MGTRPRVSRQITLLTTAMLLCASLAKAQSENSVMMPVPNGSERLELSSVALPKENFSEEVGKYFVMTPFVQSIRLGRKIRSDGVKDGSINWAKDDGKYVAGYVGLAYATHRFSNAFMQIDLEKFSHDSVKQMTPNPKKVLYVNLISDGDKLGGYAELEFRRQYGSHPGAQFIEATTAEELIRKLKALRQDASYDRIEVFAHGGPGKLGIGKTIIKETDLVGFKEAKFGFAKPGADLRFVSCSLAGGYVSDANVGERFVKEMGRAMMPEGGQIFAAARNLIAVKIPAQRMMQHVLGLSVMTNVVFSMSPALITNLKKARANVVRIDIKSEGHCPTSFSSIVSRSR